MRRRPEPEPGESGPEILLVGAAPEGPEGAPPSLGPSACGLTPYVLDQSAQLEPQPEVLIVRALFPTIPETRWMNAPRDVRCTMAEMSEGLATAPSIRGPAVLPEFSSGTVGPLAGTIAAPAIASAPLGTEGRPHGPRTEKPEKKVSPDPFYRTDRYRLVTPYSLARDPSRA